MELFWKGFFEFFNNENLGEFTAFVLIVIIGAFIFAICFGSLILITTHWEGYIEPWFQKRLKHFGIIGDN